MYLVWEQCAAVVVLEMTFSHSELRQLPIQLSTLEFLLLVVVVLVRNFSVFVETLCL